MFLDLVDRLCCPRPHDPTSLVASVRTRRGRQLIDGALGCPECRAEFEIRDGVVYLAAARRPRDGGVRAGEATDATDPDHVLRAAALLGLSEAGGLVLLGGRWGALARPLAAATGVAVVTLNAEPEEGDDPDGVSRMMIEEGLPFRAKSVRAIAFDAPTATPRLLESARVALQPRGRLVLAADAEAPAWATRLAADSADAVYESTASWSDPVVVRRARSSP